MTEEETPLHSEALIDGPRPWAFSRSELTAGLRRHTGDPSLQISDLHERDLTMRLPAIGRLRGLDVACQGATGQRDFSLVLKEPQGSTRAGTAGIGLREVSLYRVLGDHLPVRIPRLLAAHPNGAWLVMERLPEGRLPEKWQAADYLLATDQLVALHDRFWGLGEDLSTYRWLARPLDAEFDIHRQAARAGVEKLAAADPPTTLSRDTALQGLLQRVLDAAEAIAAALRAAPATLLHGEFWPGNVRVHQDGSLTVFDWEHAAIGPAMLDLLTFIQTSRWWFDPLAIDPQEIITHYRQRIRSANGHTWDEESWSAQWDAALLWSFADRWVDLLAAIPESMLATRQTQLEALWLGPVRAAAERRLPGG